MPSNVIIFTTGGGGSSVLAGLIARQGYWLGDSTRKLRFETYENDELVKLNMEILRLAGFPLKDCMELPPPSVERIKGLVGQVDLEPYQTFLKTCDAHRPWLWKDPRLCYTIHFWRSIMNVKDCKFLFTTRDPLQEFISMMKRRVIVSLRDLIEINENYRKSMEVFLQESGVSCLYCTFEELMLNTDDLLKKIAAFLELQLTRDDLKQVFRGALGRKKYSALDTARAYILYAYFRFVRQEHIKFPQLRV